MKNELLQSEHLRLRALEPEDLDLLYARENNTSLWSVSATNVPYSRSILEQFLISATYDAFVDKQVRLIAECRTTGQVVGTLDFANIDIRNRRGEVGIVVYEQFRRRGYGSELLAIAEPYVANVLALHQIYAYVNRRNRPSCRLFSRAGYVRCARLQDWLWTPEGWEDVYFYQKVF